ncbi:MAG TPA: D-glucuronyl C5-epimerase family protein [Candidatus Dormibacteraeota bacterium]|nr:D-glucuronyl C5-epimerase family protein [Candidatus Dormibacteraeota bacterium]
MRPRPRPRVMRLALLIAIVALATSTAPASGTTAPRTVLAPIAERQLVDLPLAERAFSGQPIAPLKPDFPADKDGVPIYVRNGRVETHPVVLASQGLRALDSYLQTGSAAYLTRAGAIASRLRAVGRPYGDGLFLPYSFDFRLHGTSADLLHAPWYSGMAQGMALALFVRLAAVTDDATYLGTATRLFAAMAVLGPRAGPWVSRTDADGYLWIEEYPSSHPDQTLNGFNFAIFGLYDYVLATGDPAAHSILIAALATVEHYLVRFRNPGGLSFYCLAHHVTSQTYHDIHIRQLRLLARMTGDRYFQQMADVFFADHA